MVGKIGDYELCVEEKNFLFWKDYVEVFAKIFQWKSQVSSQTKESGLEKSVLGWNDKIEGAFSIVGT